MSFITSLVADPTLLGFIILALATLILLGLFARMHFKMRRFLIGIDAKNIGDSLTLVSSGLNELQAFRSELEKYLGTVEKRLRRSVQSVHAVRFNPFRGSGEGSNQSFAAAFLNEEGDGLVISSLYSRERVSVFAKPVKKHSSEYELSNEEKEAIARSSNKS